MISLYSSLLDSLAQGVLLVDKYYRIVVWNRWLEKATGLTKNEAIGEKVANVCPCFSELKYRRMIRDAIINGENRFCSGMLHGAFFYHQNGGNTQELKRQNMQIEPFNYQGEDFALIQITDITVQYSRVSCLQNLIKWLENDYYSIQKAAEHAKRIALYDSLTGLCNRYLLFDQLNYKMTEGRKDGLLALLFIDLDGFKKINDTYGHIIGDHLLKEVAARIKCIVRSTDIVARLAGDEFVVVLSDLNAANEASLVAHKIRRSIAEKYNLADIIIRITASIGISLYPSNVNNAEDLLKRADDAMYSVKARKKNDCKFYKEQTS